MIKKIIVVVVVVFILLVSLVGYGVYRFFNPFGDAVNVEVSDSYYYTNDGKGIIYSPMGNWFSLGKDEMDVDMDTFEVLGRDYAKDKNHAYFKSVIIDFNVDVPSFNVKSGYVPIDKNHVYILLDGYYHLGDKEEGFKILEGADPESYEQLNYDFAKDKNYIFRDNEKFTEVDCNSFALINDVFCKDINGVYLIRYQKPLYKIEANAPEVVVLASSYIRDNHHVYVHTLKKDLYEEDRDTVIRIPYNNKESIQLYDENSIIKIDDSIYYEGTLMEKADAATFEEVNYGYSKDANFVFFLGEIVEGADAKTFKYNKRTYTFSDKKNTYEGGKAVTKSKNN